MFQVRELSIKVALGEEERRPLFACKVCDSTADVTCLTPSPAPLLACNVCDSTPGEPDVDCPTISMTMQAARDQRDVLQLLREQLQLQLAQLN